MAQADDEGRLPRWLRVAALIAGIAVLVAVAVSMLTGGEHGPSRHFAGEAPNAPGEGE